jgi:4a-hydroxytetrahydrobiopterin dehydratase
VEGIMTEQETKVLSAADVTARLSSLHGWTVEDGALVRNLKFASFPDAIAFVTRLAFDAQETDHHPDLTVSYTRVRVAWSTHSAGGITAKDFAGAAQSDTIAKRFGL